MSREYAESRIKEALKLAKGNPTRARQQIIAWTYEDARLLHSLAQPHLTGIVAHAVGRVIHRQNIEESHIEEDIADMPQPLDLPPQTFGEEIMRALESRESVRFGQENPGVPLGRKKASQSHIDALKQIASKSQSPKKD